MDFDFFCTKNIINSAAGHFTAAALYQEREMDVEHLLRLCRPYILLCFVTKVLRQVHKSIPALVRILQFFSV